MGALTRTKRNTPPQCTQRIGSRVFTSTEAGASAKPCAISMRAFTSSRGTAQLGDRNPK